MINLLTPYATIRNYTPADWPEVCRVHDAARPREVAGILRPEEVAPMRDVAEEDEFFDGQTIVAEEFGRVIGFLTFAGDEITWLYVDPPYHGRGIGRQLIEAVLPIIGPNAHVLCIGENAEGMAFYQAAGLRPVAIFPGSVQGRPCTCVRLALPGSRYAGWPPHPAQDALRLAGYDEADWGKAVCGEDGVWRWAKV